MLNPEELQNALDRFAGTEGYHRLGPHGDLVGSDGVAGVSDEFATGLVSLLRTGDSVSRVDTRPL